MKWVTGSMVVVLLALSAMAGSADTQQDLRDNVKSLAKMANALRVEKAKLDDQLVVLNKKLREYQKKCIHPVDRQSFDWEGLGEGAVFETMICNDCKLERNTVIGDKKQVDGKYVNTTEEERALSRAYYREAKRLFEERDK